MQIRRAVISNLILLLSVTFLAASEKQEPSPIFPEVTARGRALYEYDQAVWHATDAVRATHPPEQSIGRYIARKSGVGWTVVFGHLNERRDAFLVAYEAVEGATLQEFRVKKLDPPAEDTSFYLAAAKAIDLALHDFQGEKRPYNIAVLPASSNQLYVYVVPAQTKTGVYPYGGDVRYLITADGSAIVGKLQLHRDIIEFSSNAAPKEVILQGWHTHVLSDFPEDTDVFYVLSRQPSVQEVIATRNHKLYHINTEGIITELQGPAAGMSPIKIDSSEKPKRAATANVAQGQNLSTITGKTSHESKKIIKNVFLNIHGDEKLGHRLWTYLDLELEDRGFQVVDSERNADVVEDIEMREVVTPGTVNFALIDFRSPIDEKDAGGQQCILEAFLGSFFEKQASSLRDRFPAARTIKFDAESQWPPTTGKWYRNRFSSAIDKIGFNLVDDLPADITLRIKLQIPSVIVDYEKLELKKQIIPLGDPAKALRESASITGPIKLKAAMPVGCSYKFDDPDWAGRINLDLAREAYKLANALTQWNSGDFGTASTPYADR